MIYSYYFISVCQDTAIFNPCISKWFPEQGLPGTLVDHIEMRDTDTTFSEKAKTSYIKCCVCDKSVRENFKMCLRVQHLDTCACEIISRIARILEVCLGVLATKSGHTLDRPSVRPPIYMSGNFLSHLGCFCWCTNFALCFFLSAGLLFSQKGLW